MKTRKLLFTAFILTALYGCGYTTGALMPSGETSIYVDNFVNKIDVTREVSNEKAYYSYIPAIESDIRRRVIDRFILDGNYQIKNPDEAHFMLKGQLVEFRRDPLRYDANDNVIEYRITVVVNVELYNLKENKLIWKEANFGGESTYRTTGQFAMSENKAVDQSINDLARRIVERTVENW
ncbi:MAG: LptE family protein [Candidatus Omnitrophica bacterium]|nr:LptE family protein [Candidatus Omnitrophota bacterium]